MDVNNQFINGLLSKARPSYGSRSRDSSVNRAGRSGVRHQQFDEIPRYVTSPAEATSISQQEIRDVTQLLGQTRVGFLAAGDTSRPATGGTTRKQQFLSERLDLDNRNLDMVPAISQGQDYFISATFGRFVIVQAFLTATVILTIIIILGAMAIFDYFDHFMSNIL